ncbi:MAG: hypothetical protein KF878_04550 [Planctomycetes bacterium]|nr:hypothetical protein [Planctomycetota bacterium]
MSIVARGPECDSDRSPADWKHLERRADATTDERGTPIDPGIRGVVVGLWAHGLPTESSCEGHLLEGVTDDDPAFGPFVAPYVSIEAPPPSPHPLEVEPDVVAASPALREQARGWRVANHHLQVRLLALLERFLAGRAVPLHARLQLSPTAHEWGTCELSFAGAQATRVAPREVQAARLAEYQAELAAFAAFLRQSVT